MSDSSVCRRCGREISWGETVKRRRVPLGLVDVPADTPGALVLATSELASGLVTTSVYRLEEFVPIVAELLGCSADDAMATIVATYFARFPHSVECSASTSRRHGRAGRNPTIDYRPGHR